MPEAANIMLSFYRSWIKGPGKLEKRFRLFWNIRRGKYRRK